MEEDGREDGQRRWRPTVPTVIVVASVLVALVAVSSLIVLLFRSTTGPGEVLRRFAREVADGDCPGSYALLDRSVRDDLTEEEWCAAVPSLTAELSPDFEIKRVVLAGDVARIEVADGGSASATWLLARGDRTWWVLGSGAPLEFPSG